MEHLHIEGKTFCITGETEEYRDIYWALIVAAGGRWVRAVSRAVDFLVVGDEPGPTKMRLAEEYGVQRISEGELDAALREALAITDGQRLFAHGWRLPVENKIKRAPVANAVERGEDDGVSMKVEGQRVCITGKLDLPRAEYAERIKAAGGVLASDVSQTVAYLVIGDKPGSKVERAKKLRVPVRSLGALKSALGME